MRSGKSISTRTLWPEAEKFSVNLKDLLYNGFLSVYDYEGKKVISDTPFLNNLEMTAPALPGLYLLVVDEKYSRKTASLHVK